MNDDFKATRALAGWIVDRSRAKPTPAAVDIATLSILDTFACAIAGTSEEGPWRLLETRTTGSDLPASIWGMGTAAAPRDAALLNGMLAHMLDYDDGDMVSRMHPSCMLVPAIMAVAEPRGLGGAAVLDAYLTGYYVIQLIGRMAGKPLARRGFHVTGMIGAMGATAAVCRLLDLTAEQTANALGITATTVCGLRANFGTDMKPYHAGRAASTAVEAVEMTIAGVTASHDILEKKDGFLWTLGAPELADLAGPEVRRLIDGAYQIEAERPNIKLYACCHAMHANIQALIGLRGQLAGRLDAITEIVAEAPHTAAIYLIYPTPENGLEGKFSMQAGLAIALLDGAAGIQQFTDAAMRRSDVQALAKKIVFVPTDRMEEIHGQWKMPGNVRVKLANGEELFAEVQDTRGCRSDPCTLAEILAKFEECSAGILSAGEQAAALAKFEKFDQAADVGILSRMLRGTVTERSPELLAEVG